LRCRTHRSFEEESVVNTQIPTVAPLPVLQASKTKLFLSEDTLTSNHLATKLKVESFQHSGVIWMLINEHGLGAVEAKVLFDDMKHFLFAAHVVSGKMSLVPPNRVDLAWHCFILHTRDYGYFCNTMFGQMMHHEPINARVDAGKCACCDSSCGISREGDNDRQEFATPEETMQVITALFGQELSDNWMYTKMQKLH
jgi:hypothetical protein